MASSEQVAMPAQDRVGAYQAQEVPQLVFGELVQQAGEDRAVGLGEHRLPGLALQDEELALQDKELVPQRQYLDVLVAVPHRQQAQERQGVGRSEMGQAQ
ncbi:hypothetical protein [Streptomyces mirabilis]|uniref:hypothetical protein n=1 Tax=Streptomyces mirabilis TaxID=68239 RepID=UPI0038B4D193